MLNSDCHSLCLEGTHVSDLYKTGCLVCGTELIYLDSYEKKQCFFCGKVISVNVCCNNGHFVCDLCHLKGSQLALKEILINSDKKDLVELFIHAREKASLPMHGPEYHGLVAGIILTCVRNNGGSVKDVDIKMGFDLGNKTPGGYCGFAGLCGAVAGTGVAVSIVLKSTPLKGEERSKVLRVTSELLKKISNYQGARCCQRESVTALNFFSEISKDITGMHVPSNEIFVCSQYSLNKSCIGKRCPYFTKNKI